MPSNLLEEAIVDAEALREAALKSAQAAILERYAPDVKKAIQVILEAEVTPTDKEEDSLGALGNDSLPSLGTEKGSGLTGDGAASGAPPGIAPPEAEDGPDPTDAVKKLPMAATEGEKLCACPDEDEEVEINFDELEKQMAATEPDDNIPDGVPDKQHMNIKLAEEIELDEDLLRGLFESTDDEDETGRDEKAPTVPAMEEGEELDEATVNPWAVCHSSVGPKKTDKFERCVQDVKKNNGLKESQIPVKKQSVTTQSPKLNEKKGVSQSSPLIKENKELTKVKQELLDENKKVKKAVHDLTKRLEEVNLSNAKLVCTNKALTSNSLNERQKTKIVEAISKAESVDDVNLIFETLQQSVGSGHNKQPEPKSLNEAIGNKNGLKFNRREPEQSKNPVYDRWGKMAGIKK